MPSPTPDNDAGIGTGDGAGPTAETPRGGEAMNRLRADFATLKDDARRLWDDVRDVAREQSTRGVGQGQTIAGQAREQAIDARRDIEDRIRRHPLAAVGIALGAGLLLSSLGRRR
jgi:ElaB/YqjD/DUF883 family membrane-anchored ribosome-binding protein